MELRQLRHFVALAEERSVTAAARRELIVQSGLSNSIQALERELGSELYLRGTRPIRLTATGQALLNPARDVLNAADAAERIVHDTREVLVGRPPPSWRWSSRVSWTAPCCRPRNSAAGCGSPRSVPSRCC